MKTALPFCWLASSRRTNRLRGEEAAVQVTLMTLRHSAAETSTLSFQTVMPAAGQQQCLRNAEIVAHPFERCLDSILIRDVCAHRCGAHTELSREPGNSFVDAVDNIESGDLRTCRRIRLRQ